MSSVTFVIIYKGKAKYVTGHYSSISDLLKGIAKPESFREMCMSVSDGRLSDYTDTGFNPCVIIDFDSKILSNTPFNWFDDFKKYMPNDWIYKEIKIA